MTDRNDDDADDDDDGDDDDDDDDGDDDGDDDDEYEYGPTNLKRWRSVRASEVTRIKLSTKFAVANDHPWPFSPTEQKVLHLLGIGSCSPLGQSFPCFPFRWMWGSCPRASRLTGPIEFTRASPLQTSVSGDRVQ